MNFEEHLENHRRADGSYDLDGAETDRRNEVATNPSEIVRLAAKVAHTERVAWMNKETANLRKQFAQPALAPSLELDIMVPLGDGTVVRLGDMTHDRIRLRKDMRVRAHIDETRAFNAEMTHWLRTEMLLNDGESIEGAIRRGDAA